MNKDVYLPVDPFGYVRVLRVDDACQDYVEALNDKDLTSFMVASERLFTIEDVKAYIRQNIGDPQALLFGIFDRNDRLIGTSRVHDISDTVSLCWMGIFIFHRDAMGKGLGSRVVRAISDYVMEAFDLTSVQASILSANQSSLACFRKAGFVMIQNGLEYQGQAREIWECRRENA